MITCEIEDNRHFAQIANIGSVQVADALISGETLEFPHELLAGNSDRNGSWRTDLPRISGPAYRWDCITVYVKTVNLVSFL